MIVVKIQLWPKGDPSRAKDLGTATISNTSGAGRLGTYTVKLFKAGRYAGRNAGQLWKGSTVCGFPRTSRRCGPWELLARGILAAVGKERMKAAGWAPEEGAAE